MTDADRTDSVVFNRRDFLKLVGLGAIGAAGCAPRPAERLIPYLVPPEDILPGVGYWYASTCRECPAGCGILVKAREGRAVKIEGNPAHPVNRGGVCARGHAALQALYDPDRVRGPLLKSGGAWKPVSWDEALKTASAKLAEARSGGKSIALVTDNVTGSLHRLADAWAAAAGGTHLVYEPFTHHALREANRRTFNVAAIPAYDFGRAGGVISFGADFLETWLNPVGFARGFAEMRARPESFFVTVEPRLSNTGANADEWIAVRPGGEMAVALGMALVILQENLGPGVAERAVLLDAVKDWTPDVVEQQTDVPATTLERVARRFANARPTLAVAGGVAAQSEMAVALIAAVNLLNYVAGNIGQTVRPHAGLRRGGVAVGAAAAGGADGGRFRGSARRVPRESDVRHARMGARRVRDRQGAVPDLAVAGARRDHGGVRPDLAEHPRARVAGRRRDGARRVLDRAAGDGAAADVRRASPGRHAARAREGRRVRGVPGELRRIPEG